MEHEIVRWKAKCQVHPHQEVEERKGEKNGVHDEHNEQDKEKKDNNIEG